MSRRWAGWVGALALWTAVAHAGPEALLPKTWAEGVDWTPQPVRLANPDEVRPVAPYVPSRSGEATGAVKVSKARAAVVHLAPLGVLRVRAEGGTPRFERLPLAEDPSAASVRLEEPGVAARQGLWYLAEPMGGGSLWLVRADSELTVEVERPEPYERALSDEAVRAGLLSWIDGRGPRPPLPFHPELRHQLERDLELGELLSQRLPQKSAVREALADFRKASALRGWALVQPLRPSTSRVVTHLPEGEAVPVEGSSQTLSRPPGDNGRWELSAEGPGILEVEVRRLFAEGAAEDAVLEVYEDGALLGRVIAPARAAFASDTGAALPLARTLRRTAHGEQLGPSETLRVPLRRGAHRYQIEWKAGAVALRAREARRRPWLSDRLDGAADWSEWAERAVKALHQDTSPEAVLLRRELARLDPRLPAPQEGVATDTLPAGLRAVSAIGAVAFGAQLNDAAALLALLDEARLPPEGALAWSLRLELADHLIVHDRPEDARAVLQGGRVFPRSGWLAAAAARRLAQLPAEPGIRSRELAALELAWRKEPLSAAIAAEYTRRFYDAARWQSGVPRARDERPLARRWLDVGQRDEGRLAGQGALTPLSAGQTATLEILPEEAPRLVRLYVVGPPGTMGTRVHAGEQQFPVPQLEPVEPVELALPAGAHPLRLEGPSGVVAYAATAAPAAGAHAFVRTQYALSTGGEEARFPIADGHLPTPVRVQLRPEGALKAPVAVWLRTDVGEARRLWLYPGAASERSRALDLGGPSAVPTSSLVLHLPALVREVWFEPEEKDVALFASVSIRATSGAPVRTAPATSVQTDLVNRLLVLSRELERAPEDPDRLLERAQLLAEVGEESLARADVDTALDLRTPLDALQARVASALIDRLDADEDERLPFTAPITTPTLLRPALGVLEPAAAERYRRARRSLAEGNPGDAALALAALYRDTGALPVGLEALAAAERTRLSREQRWREGVAAVAYGVAERMRGFGELPSVRRVRREAARWTRWDRLADAEQQAGGVQALQDAPPEELTVAVRKALLAPPWTLGEGRVVRAGNASVLEVTADTAERYGAEVLCRTWPTARDAGPGPCRVALRVDGAVAAEREIAHGEVGRIEAQMSAPGTHQLELLLQADRAPRAAVIRFLRLGGEAVALEAQRPLTFLRSSPTLPVTVTVLGPTVLRVGARALGAGTPRRLAISARPENAETESAFGVEVPAQEDASVTGTPLPVSSEAEAVVLLPEPGPHRVRFESAEGDVLVRLRAAASERPAPLARTHPRALRRPEPLPWPALPERLSLMPDATREGPGRRLGLLTVELGARDERLDEEELGRALRTGAEAALAWRLELAPERWWLRTAAQSRVYFDRAPAFGTEVAVHGRGLPLDVRVSLSARGNFQALEVGTRWNAGARASVDRWIPLGLDVALIPSLAAEYTYFAGGGDAAAYDLSVYSPYAARHPLRVTPRASLRWQPLQDQLGGLSAWAMTNSHEAALDHVSAELRWSSLWTWPLSPLRTELGYGASWRFADADRAEAFLRHHARVGADWAIWSGVNGRLLLFAEDRVHYSTPFGLQNVVGGGLRWDLSGGRGLRDLAPPEEEFDHLLDPRRTIH